MKLRRRKLISALKIIIHNHHHLKYVDQPQLVENMRIAAMLYLKRKLLEKKSAFSQLLIAPVSIALKGHTYCFTEEHQLLQSPLITTSVSLEQMIDYHPPPEFEKDSLNVTPEEKVRIEIATRDQSQSAEWHMVRSRRITGSMCGKILKQKANTSFVSTYPLSQTVY